MTWPQRSHADVPAQSLVWVFSQVWEMQQSHNCNLSIPTMPLWGEQFSLRKMLIGQGWKNLNVKSKQTFHSWTMLECNFSDLVETFHILANIPQIFSSCRSFSSLEHFSSVLSWKSSNTPRTFLQRYLNPIIYTTFNS